MNSKGKLSDNREESSMNVYILCDHNQNLDPVPVEAFISMELATLYRARKYSDNSDDAYPIFEMPVLEFLD